MSIGPAEIMLVLVIALLVFGPSRLPGMGRSLGRGIREFRKAASAAKEELGLSEITDQINGIKTTLGEPMKDVASSVNDLTVSVADKTTSGASAVGRGVAQAGAAGRTATGGPAGASARAWRPALEAAAPAQASQPESPPAMDPPGVVDTTILGAERALRPDAARCGEL